MYLKSLNNLMTQILAYMYTGRFANQSVHIVILIVMLESQLITKHGLDPI